MATIREKAPYQWQVQIRRMGWPNQNATFRTKKDAEAWARKVSAIAGDLLKQNSTGSIHILIFVDKHMLIAVAKFGQSGGMPCQ
jgi:hypothetical protein